VVDYEIQQIKLYQLFNSLMTFSFFLVRIFPNTMHCENGQ